MCKQTFKDLLSDTSHDTSTCNRGTAGCMIARKLPPFCLNLRALYSSTLSLQEDAQGLPSRQSGDYSNRSTLKCSSSCRTVQQSSRPPSGMRLSQGSVCYFPSI